MSEFKFILMPHYCDACIFTEGCWCEVSLTRAASGDVLQRVIVPVRRGSTLYGTELLPYMRQLTLMFMSTTRGLSA